MKNANIGWIIKSNLKKYVSESEYNDKGDLKYSWSINPADAKVYLEKPSECPANAIIHEVFLDNFYQVVTENGEPKILVNKNKPFYGENEFRTAEDAISKYIENNEKNILAYQGKIEIYKNNISIAKEKLLLVEEGSGNNKKQDFQFFKELTYNRILNFSIPLWGHKFTKILGKTITSEQSVIFTNSKGDVIATVSEKSIGTLIKKSSTEYIIQICPENNQAFILYFEFI